MTFIAFIVLFTFAGPVMAGFNEARTALSIDEKQEGQLRTLLSRPPQELAGAPEVSELLAKNSAALDLFRRAIEENDGAYYPFSENEDVPGQPRGGPVFRPYVILARLALLDAKSMAARGNRPKVEANLQAVAWLISQFYAQKSDILLSGMTGNLILQDAFPVFSDSLRGPSVSAGYLQRISSRLEKMLGHQDFIRSALKEEADKRKSSFKALIEEDIASAKKEMPFWKRPLMSHYFDEKVVASADARMRARADQLAAVWAKTFGTGNPAMRISHVEAFLKNIEARLKPDREGGQNESVERGSDAWKKREGETLGDTLFLRLPQFDYIRIVPRYHIAVSWIEILRTAAAVKRHQRQHGRLPAGVKSLVPDFLPKPPRDPFNRYRPLNYSARRGGFVVYGLGPDGVDDGGGTEFDFMAYETNGDRGSGDIVLRGY